MDRARLAKASAKDRRVGGGKSQEGKSRQRVVKRTRILSTRIAARFERDHER